MPTKSKATSPRNRRMTTMAIPSATGGLGRDEVSAWVHVGLMLQPAGS
jgi:hypothetical protein